MTIDLTQFHDAFFEESFEALDSMESALLKLDIGAPEPELINTIFRVAHSIKGGSATFGFSDIASFTHSCETLLDELRSGGMQVSLEISDLLLKTVDVMRAMLRSTQSKQPLDMQKVSDVQFDVEMMIAQKNNAPAIKVTPAVVAPLKLPWPPLSRPWLHPPLPRRPLLLTRCRLPLLRLPRRPHPRVLHLDAGKSPSVRTASSLPAATTRCA